MDRCRCEEYEDIISKLRFRPIGGYLPQAIEAYDRGNLKVIWVPQRVGSNFSDYYNFERARVVDPDQLNTSAEDSLSENSKKIEKMWCKYLAIKKKQA